MKTLSTQKTREVTDVELKYLEKDSSMSLEAIQYYIDNKIPFDLEDEQQIFSPALYDFTGFHQTSNGHVLSMIGYHFLIQGACSQGE